MRVLEPRGNRDFTLESFGRDGRRRVGWQDFHDDLSAESPLGGDEDVRHSAGCQLTLQRKGIAEGALQLVLQVGRGQGPLRAVRAPTLARWVPVGKRAEYGIPSWSPRASTHTINGHLFGTRPRRRLLAISSPMRRFSEV